MNLDKLLKRYRIERGKHFRLKDYDPADTHGLGSELKPPARHSRGPGSLGPAPDFSGYGRRRQRRNHQARHVRSESAGRSSLVIQGAHHGGAPPWLPMALHEICAGPGENWHLQPFLLRGGAGGARPPPDSGKPEVAGNVGHQTYLGGTL